jgi:hypothetical protein
MTLKAFTRPDSVSFYSWRSRVRFGQYAVPTEIPFQEIGIAKIAPVSRAKFDEIAGGLAPGLMQHPKILTKLRVLRSIVHQIAYEQGFLSRGVSDQTGGSQEIRIENRVELAQAASTCPAFYQDTGGARKHGAAQSRDQGLHADAIISHPERLPT